MENDSKPIAYLPPEVRVNRPEPAAAAHKGKPGDLLVILTFVSLNPEEASGLGAPLNTRW